MLACVITFAAQALLIAGFAALPCVLLVSALDFVLDLASQG